MQGAGLRAIKPAWVITWIAYATYYAGRKGFPLAKKAIHDKLGVSVDALGVIDTVYLGAYALGQFISGAIGDSLGARRLIGVGMLLSAAACAAFGLMNAALAFGVLYAVNGLAQSTGWPGTTRAMAEWTTPQVRGTVMGYWATCYQAGGIIWGWLCAILVAAFGWRSGFFVPAASMALVGLLVLATLRPGPGGEGSALAPDAGTKASAEELAQRKAAQRAMWKGGTLWSYGASYFFIKFIRYTLLFWLPFYLETALHYDRKTAGLVPIAFDVGGIIGVIAIGTLSDRLRHLSRAALSATILAGLAAALLIYTRAAHAGVVANVLALALVGAALFAPDSLLSGAAAQDAGGAHAAATATGMVNGVGSIGSMISGLAVPQLSKRLGWDALVPTLVLLAVLSSAALLPAVLAMRRRPSAEP